MPSNHSPAKNNISTHLQDEDDEEPVDDLDEGDQVIPFTYSITSYGADYPVESMVRRVESKDIVVPVFSWKHPEDSDILGFQRDYVWPRSKADRFIESLLLGLPVPGVFLVKEPSGVFLVLDGHQRLHTLHSFYQGAIGGVEYRLSNVQHRFSGLRYKDLDIEDRRRIDDSIIHATIVRQDQPTEDQSSIYAIFERLNTGGVNLQPQEIRVALYHGKFVRVLQSLNEDPAWRQLYGAKSRRLKDMELILRFLAFFYYASKYEAPMKIFLNRYMATNRELAKQSEDQLRDIFTRVCQVILEGIGSKAFRPSRAVNAAVVDSLMNAIAKRIASKGSIKNFNDLNKRFNRLMDSDRYKKAIETGTSQEANVRDRLALAEKAFATVS